VWATAVYLISRSHEKNVLNLTPIWLTILALSLRFGKNSLALIQTASLIMLSSFAFYQKPLHFFEAVSSIISKIPFQAGNGAIWDSSRCSELIEREWCSLVFLSTSFASNSNGDFFHWIPMVLLISSILSLDQQFQDIHRSIGDSNGGFWSQITSVRRVFFRTLRSFSGSEFNQFNLFCWKHFS